MRIVIFLVVGALAAFVALGVLSTYSARSHRVEAEAFLRLLVENHPETAYVSATERFHSDFGPDAFLKFVKNLRLDQYQSDSLEIESGQSEYEWKEGFTAASLAGRAKLRDDTKFRIQMKLRPDRGVWRVDYIYVTMPKKQGRGKPGTVAAPDSLPGSKAPASSPVLRNSDSGTDATPHVSPVPSDAPPGASPGAAL